MTRFILAAAMAFSIPAHADVPNGITERVARFVLDGCEYLRKNRREPFKREPPRKKLAAHFGRIVRTQPRGIGIEYALQTPGFDGWQIAYWEHGVDMTFPQTVAITMGDMQQYFGQDKDVDFDAAMAATPSDGDPPPPEQRVFELREHGFCRVFVETQPDARLGPARRVFSLRVAN